MRGLHAEVTGVMRIAMIALAAMVAVVATSDEADARQRRRLAHCRPHSLAAVRIAAPVAPTLGPMRYYGGPKSPMWRAAAGT
jgi:hypothetical protein